MAIQMLDNSLWKVINKRDYLQFNTVRQLRAAVLDVYSATSMSHASRYLPKSHLVSVLHIYKGAMYLALM